MNNVRFIKLGFGGGWESSCIQDGVIRLGYESPHHEDSLAGNWDVVRGYWLKHRNGDEKTTTNDVRQIRDFYELDESTLWITFYKRSLYWCRAEREISILEDGSRIRKAIGNWSSNDVNGKPLRLENIDGRVTKVQGFRGTICSIELVDYLIRKINGQTTIEVEKAKNSLDVLRNDVEDLIKGLWWHDFELLVDLIFAKAGWQRFSVLGKTEKDIDLDVYSPASQKRAFVQIKSSTTSTEINSYINSFEGYGHFSEMYFIFHTCSSDVSNIENLNKNVHILDLKKISALVVSSGLVEWLINKRS